MEEEPQASPGQEAPQPPAAPCLDSPRHRQRASLPPASNATARHVKRQTLNFPIGVQLPAHDPSATEHSSPSPDTMRLRNSTTSPPDRSSTASPSALNEHQNDNYPILTAIASQERKVLELKEELQKAETELATLKKKWAVGERGRKRNEVVHRAEALKPLSPTQPSYQVEEEDNNNNKESSEADKRQSADLSTLPAQTRLSQDPRRQNSVSNSPIESPGGGSDSGMSVSARGRTVFQNSRHTRNLSLLSPTTSGPSQMPSSPQLPREVDDPRRLENPRSSSRLPRSATLPSMDRKDDQSKTETAGEGLSNESQVDKAAWRRSLPPTQDPRAEALVRTGRQMATDFRDGLWTFIDDIRQATVGEEGVNGTGSRPAQGSQAAVQRTSSRRNGVPSSASREGSAASSRNTKRPTVNRAPSTSSGKTPAGRNMEVSFWSEFGVDAPEQTPAATHTTSTSDPNNDQNNQGEPSQAGFDDNWGDWGASQAKTHTPSSSSSTFPKRDPSPPTNTSSPRTSTRYVYPLSGRAALSSVHVYCHVPA